MLPENPHVRYFESRAHGFVTLDFTPDRLETRMQAISDRTRVDASLSTLRTFVVEDGRPGAV